MRTVGVEEELLLVAADGSSPAPIAPAVIAQSEAGPGAAVEHEFKQEQVEIGSSPQTDLAELTAELARLRTEAAEAAAASGVALAAIATSPWKLSPRSSPDERYLRMVDQFGLLAREQLTCGQHVHIGVDSRAEGVAVLDRIRGWLPILLAISANSPFWQQQDTGCASYRSVLWGRWPSAGASAEFGDEAGYDAVIAALIDTESALDDGMIYFDARLSAHYPTVEIRVADVCTDLADAVLIAAIARGLVETAVGHWHAGQPVPAIRPELLRAASWRASRWGLTHTLVEPRSGRLQPAWSVIAELFELIEPALRASGDRELVLTGLDRLRRLGGGAQRQRAVAGPGEDLRAVLLDAIERTLRC